MNRILLICLLIIPLSSSAAELSFSSTRQAESIAPPPSKKGAWNKKDKRKARKAVQDVRHEVEDILGNKTDAFILCYLGRVEAAYTNFKEADKDLEGCTILAEECAAGILKK